MSGNEPLKTFKPEQVLMPRLESKSDKQLVNTEALAFRHCEEMLELAFLPIYALVRGLLLFRERTPT
jgi:hypothetical protein